MVAHGCLFRQLEDPPKDHPHLTIDGHRLNMFQPEFHRRGRHTLGAMATAAVTTDIKQTLRQSAQRAESVPSFYGHA